MKIHNLLNQPKTALSFEVFPPKKDSNTFKNMDRHLLEFASLDPDFISVTYGALGSTNKNTNEIAKLIKEKHKINSLAHLTCIASSKDEVNENLTDLKNSGCESILALRGDIPANMNLNELPHPLEFEYASDLITHIRKIHGDTFSLGGACYPEGHIESRSSLSDIINLKNKVDSGLDFLISQVFFDNNIYYKFLDECQKYNIDLPILGGIMPVLNKNQIEKIVSMCGASLPQKFLKIMDRYEHDPLALEEAGAMYALDQIIDLQTNGVSGIHIYSMNRPDITRKIITTIPNILRFYKS